MADLVSTDVCGEGGGATGCPDPQGRLRLGVRDPPIEKSLIKQTLGK